MSGHEVVPGGRSGGGRVAAAFIIVLGVSALAVGTAGMLAGREPFATWYYQFAWGGTLLVADGLIAWTRALGHEARFLLLGRPAFTLTALAWSAVLWLFFELLNVRLRNWFYVFVPDDPVARWVGILTAFATVLPAVLAAEAVLRGFGFAAAARSPRLRVGSGALRGLRVAGWLMLALPLLFPRWFFPLVWGAVTLLLEPDVYRRDRTRSLLADLEAGNPSRVLRLLVGGAAIGLLWELYNYGAHAKWMYTVPGLEELKLFEMPLLGFLGFPVFALECWVVWQALVGAGVAVPRVGPVRPAPARARAGCVIAGAAFAAGTLLLMERHTIQSYTPPPGLGTEETRLVQASGLDAATLEELAALGIDSVERLAVQDWRLLASQLRERGADVYEPRVRVWITSARRAVEDGN